MKPQSKKSYDPTRVLLTICILITATSFVVYKYINKPNHNIKAVDPLYNTALATTVDSITVIKKNRIMMVYGGGKLLKKYKVSLGAQPVGPKHCEGDNKTPEGRYYISVKNAGSKYHKSLGVSYPNETDRRYAQKNKQPTGGDIMIHGLPNNFIGDPNGYTRLDWTAGCISVNNQQIDELYTHVEMRTPITILP